MSDNSDYLRGVNDNREMIVRYWGAAESLIAAGAATAELLARGKPGKTRRDSNGDRAMVHYRKGWLQLWLYKSIETACRLPGVTPAVVAEARERTRQALKAYGVTWDAEVAPVAKERRPSYLRLVVDNRHLEVPHG